MQLAGFDGPRNRQSTFFFSGKTVRILCENKFLLKKQSLIFKSKSDKHFLVKKCQLQIAKKTYVKSRYSDMIIFTRPIIHMKRQCHRNIFIFFLKCPIQKFLSLSWSLSHLTSFHMVSFAFSRPLFF